MIEALASAFKDVSPKVESAEWYSISKEALNKFDRLFKGDNYPMFNEKIPEFKYIPNFESEDNIKLPATSINKIWNELFSNDENVENQKDVNNIEGTESEGKDVDESAEKKGGRFGDVFKDGEGDKYEVHHMPADSTTELERNDGPAIRMDKEDHRQTASCGNSREAREYRAKQKELIESGKFRESLQMDIDDIHEKFGDKYDDAIAEMLEYVSKLEEEGKV